MKKLLSIAALFSLGFSANWSVMPYGSYIDYSNNILKKKAYLEGAYASVYSAPFKLEVDGENLKIKYRPYKYGNNPDWKQQDLTLVGHYYLGYNYDFKLGIHNLFVDDGTSKYYEKAFIGGVLFYKTLKYNVGLDYYYARFHGGFHTSQFTPKAGINFGNYYSMFGSFYAEVKANIIRISKDNKAPKQNYTNFDLKLDNFIGSWTTTLKASLGKFAYKVGADGFAVYNTADEYKYDAGIKVSYKLSKTDSVAVSYGRSKFNTGGVDAFSNSYLISYAHAF